MRKLVLLFCATAFLGACSSAKKQEAPATTPTVSEKAAEVKGKVSKAAKKAGAEAKQAINEATSTSNKIECKNGSDVRVVEVKTTGTSCEVQYTKGSAAPETKATGLASSGHCTQVLEKMKGNLTTSGFACN